MSRFSCQVFHREMDVAAIGVCVSMAKEQCEKVAEDSLYMLHYRVIIIRAAKLRRLQR